MNHKQCTKIIRLKKKLRTVPKTEFYELARLVGINEVETELLIGKFCLAKSNTSLGIKHALDEGNVSESINKNLQKIVFYLEATSKRIDDYAGVIEKVAK